MRKYLIVMSLAAFLAPQAALACPSMSSSSIAVNCESGVSVYRGSPLAAPVIRVQPKQRGAAAKALASSQQALIAAQERRINALEDNVDNLEQRANPSRSRGRYNRNFSVPIGAFGRGVGSGFGGRINSRLGGNINFSRGGAFGGRRF